MKFWKSVVFKLWSTFLLLVSVVLLILTTMLLEYFEQYHNEQTEKGLTDTALKMAELVKMQADQREIDIVWTLLDSATGAIIQMENKEYSHQPEEMLESLSLEYMQSIPKLRDVASKNQTQVHIAKLQKKNGETEQIAIVGVPIEGGNHRGAVYIYQSLELLNETQKSTTKFIILAAVVAIILTTIFAFFLLTRITAPLRRMREAAFELARGNFDTKVPITAQDEIGELGIAFNEMAKRLNFNMNALSQEKEQLGNILSGMADGVITFNKNGSLLITNPPADKFLQYWYYDQMEQQPSKEQVPSVLMDLFHAVVTTGDELIDEISIQGRHWVIIVSPLYNKESIRGVIAVIRDMTEERKLDKLRIDFIANVSHELRTPISMLQGYSEAIVDDIADTEEEKKQMAQVIYDESLRMGKLVNELLDLARMESGHLELRKEEVELDPFISRINRKFQGVSKEKDINLQISLLENGRSFIMDPDRMEQVLTNIIDNCIRHTPSNGTVQLTCRLKDTGLAFQIEDNGTGIPDEDLPFVFERFYKADKARTRGNAGTGLGLAIAKNIVEAHEGEITVHSNYGKGTSFFIFLPRISD